MTRRRDHTTAKWLARCMLVTVTTALLGACAALPDDAPIVEKLDTETGTTVTRLGRPVELYRETFHQETAGRFAFVGPFETNLMGQRESFVWLAVPIEPSEGEVPVIEVDGAELPLGTPGRDADFASLHTSPYKIPTPWSAMFYFKVDDAIVARLAQAGTVAVRVLEPGKSGPVKTSFSLNTSTDPRLKDFAAR